MDNIRGEMGEIQRSSHAMILEVGVTRVGVCVPLCLNRTPSSVSWKSLRSNKSNTLCASSSAQTATRRIPCTRHVFLISVHPSLVHPLMRAGSHAEASVPIGGYLCPPCSIRGPHVHHCSEGTFVMTPATCLPQPHQVVLSGAGQC
jgi:hypothetical protein